MHFEKTKFSLVDAKVPVYYLPIWFQAVKGNSAVESGIHLLPMVLPIVVAFISTGQLVSRIGYYTPFMIFGVCLTAVAAGLLTTLGIHTSVGKWIGYQILYGYSLGSASEAPNMAAQTVLPREDVAFGASLMFFGQQLFAAVFVSVGQNVLDNQLAKRLVGIPGINPTLIQSTGATNLLNQIPVAYHATALIAYNDSLRVCFQIALIMTCLSVLSAIGMEWRSVKKNKNLGGKQAIEEGKGEGDLSEKEASRVEVEAGVVPAAQEEKVKTAPAGSTEASCTSS